MAGRSDSLSSLPSNQLAQRAQRRSRTAKHSAARRSNVSSESTRRASHPRAPRLLLVEPEPALRLALGTTLRAQSYDVQEAATGAEGLLKLASGRPRLVLVNVELPDMDGVELTRRIREQSDAPVIIVSGRADDLSQILALDSGANDYIEKLVSEATFLARVRAALRASASDRSELGSIAVGCLRIDSVQSRVWVRGVEVALTRTEFRLLSVLMREAGRVLTHRYLLRGVWGSLHVREIQYLRVYMKQLREKLERDPARPELLLTSSGVGYRLNLSG